MLCMWWRDNEIWKLGERSFHRIPAIMSMPNCVPRINAAVVASVYIIASLHTSVIFVHVVFVHCSFVREDMLYVRNEQVVHPQKNSPGYVNTWARIRYHGQKGGMYNSEHNRPDTLTVCCRYVTIISR